MAPPPDVPDGVPLRMTLRLPFSDEGEREYWVTRHGHDYLFHDDIVVADTLPRVRGNVVDDTDRLWPGAQIPIEFDPSLSDSCRGAVLEVVNPLGRVSVLSFRNARPEDRHRVRVVQSDAIPAAGQSELGRKGGAQNLTFRGTPTQRTVVHELLHAAGMHHEHARGDRDEFVEVLEENIEDDREHNFDKAGTSRGGYDLNSVMHYHGRSFGKKRADGTKAETMRLRTPDGGTAPLPAHVGRADWPSPGDVAALGRLYADVGSQFGHVDGSYRALIEVPATGMMRGEIVWDASAGLPAAVQPVGGIVDYLTLRVRVATEEVRTWRGGQRTRGEFSGWSTGPAAVFFPAFRAGAVWTLPYAVTGLPVETPVRLSLEVDASRWANRPEPAGGGLPTGRRTFQLVVAPAGEQEVAVPLPPVSGQAAAFRVAGRWSTDQDGRAGKVFGTGTPLDKVRGRPDWVQRIGKHHERLDRPIERIDDIDIDIDIDIDRGGGRPGG